MSKGVKKDGSRTAKMKSLAGATHVLIEETDELGEDDFDQLDLSLRTIKAPVKIIRVFNPPGKTHWIWRDYVLIESEIKGYFTAQAKTEANLLSIFSDYNDNKINIQQSTIDKFESFAKIKPEYYYTVIKGLISEGMRGRIFSGWQVITNDEFNKIEARSIFGQDWGTAAPAGTVEVKMVNNRMYIREQNYEPATEKQIAILYCELGLEHEPIIADSAERFAVSKMRAGWSREELSIEEIEKYPMLLKGFNIYGVHKPAGSINSGIKLLKDTEIFVTEDSTNLWKEYREYKWALDKNKNPTDDPEDKNNHLIDAARYVRWSKGVLF